MNWISEHWPASRMSPMFYTGAVALLLLGLYCVLEFIWKNRGQVNEDKDDDRSI